MQKFFRIVFVSAGTLLAVVTAPFSMAQDENQRSDIEPRLNSPGSVLHGRTQVVAEWLLGAINDSNRRAAEQAGNPIPEELTYNQITNLNQLASLETVTGWPYSEDLHFSYYYLLFIRDLRAGDLAGLVNLKAAGFSNLKAIEAGAFDGLPNLEVLHLIFSPGGEGGPLPADLFNPLANSLKDLRVAFGGTDLVRRLVCLCLCLRERLTGSSTWRS